MRRSDHPQRRVCAVLAARWVLAAVTAVSRHTDTHSRQVVLVGVFGPSSYLGLVIYFVVVLGFRITSVPSGFVNCSDLLILRFQTPLPLFCAQTKKLESIATNETRNKQKGQDGNIVYTQRQQGSLRRNRLLIKQVLQEVQYETTSTQAAKSTRRKITVFVTTISA